MGAPRFCSLNSARNSCPSGSAISSPSISRLIEKAWPARMERARKSSDSGNCSSSVSSRFLRLARTTRYGIEPKNSARTTAVVGPLNRKGTNMPKPTPGIIISTMAANRRVDDQFKPGLLDLFLRMLGRTACWRAGA